MNDENILGNRVLLDACSRCQLKCHACSNTYGLIKDGHIGWGHLTFENFKKFVDNHPWVKRIEFSGHGEPFLNPEFAKIFKYGYEKKLILSSNNGNNFNTVSDEVLEATVKYQVKALTISIDGTTPDIYKIYRVNGDFNKVINNIKKLNEYKKKYNSELPKLRWQFVIFGHNEHQIEDARKMAKELNMDFVTKLNWSKEYAPVKNKELVKKQTESGAYSRDDFAELKNKPYKLPCKQLWSSPIVSWDGKLLGCCVNKGMDFGNVFELGLKECLNSEKYIHTKRVVMGLEKPNMDIPCLKCPNFGKVLENPMSEEQVTKLMAKFKL